jgi:hypothetical protein
MRGEYGGGPLAVSPRRDRGAVGHTPAVARVGWKTEPDEHDYPAAASYLSLLAVPDEVARIVNALRAATIGMWKAKDILRASGLELLDRSNPHVASDLEKVRKGHPLSPVLLVRGDLANAHRLQIADGYHRVCASYHLDENTDIPCRIAAVEPAQPR